MLELAFYRGTRAQNPAAGWMDRLICWWTGSPFSHVEFVQERLGPWGVCWAASNRDGEVRRTTIDLTTGRWQIVTIPYGDYNRMLRQLQGDERRGYAWLGALSHGMPRPLRHAMRLIDRQRRYCSQEIALGLGWEFDAAQVSPGELHTAILS